MPTLWVLEDMQPLPLDGALPLIVPINFLFTKLHFGLLSMVVHGFLYLPPIVSLDNSIGIFISRPIQIIYNLEISSEHIYNLKNIRV